MRINPLLSSIAVVYLFLAFSHEARCAFIRADVNADGTLDLADPVTTLGHLFLGTDGVGCLEAADSTDDGALDLTDAVFSLAFLFLGGPSPSEPYPACGEDPTADGLGCEEGQVCRPTACGDPTPAVTEGPYYETGSPERASLLDEGMTGTRLIVSGYVLSPDCEPIPKAWLDFWHADADGDYDNVGYTLRGHQFTDSAGRYRLETIVPGIYPGRTEHIHVKVQAPGGPVVTSQLFFPGSTHNEGDTIFRPELLISIQETGDVLIGSFDFVVALGG